MKLVLRLNEEILTKVSGVALTNHHRVCEQPVIPAEAGIQTLGFPPPRECHY